MGVMSSQQAIPAIPLGGGVSIPAIGLGTYALRGRRGYQAMRTALVALTSAKAIDVTSLI